MFQECRHIKASGTKCQAPALKDEKFCYFHSRSRAHAKRHVDHWEAIEIPLLEDRSAIQRALSEVANAIANNRIDPKRAGLLLYTLQIASQNAKNQAEIVGGGFQVREVTQSEDGVDLGPEVTSQEDMDANPLAAIMDFVAIGGFGFTSRRSRAGGTGREFWRGLRREGNKGTRYLFPLTLT